MLLCHGAFVSLHHPVPGSPGAGHSAHAAHTATLADATTDAGERPAVGTGHVAALLFMLGTSLGLWLAVVRKDRAVRVVRPPITEVLPSYLPYPVQAPALASLQVFRL